MNEIRMMATTGMLGYGFTEEARSGPDWRAIPISSLATRARKIPAPTTLDLEPLSSRVRPPNATSSL